MGDGPQPVFRVPVTGKDEIHIGQITGDYHFAADDVELVEGDSASTRRVKWLRTVRRSAFSRHALLCLTPDTTVHSGAGYLAEVRNLLG